MRRILLILSLLIGLNSFAQDDFFWSYSHTQTYDTIFIAGTPYLGTVRITPTTLSGSNSLFERSDLSQETLINATYTQVGGLVNTLNNKIINNYGDLQKLVIQSMSTPFLGYIDFSQSKKLSEITLTTASLSDIDFTKNKALINIDFSGVSLFGKTINLSNNNLLQRVSVLFGANVGIDISNNPILQEIWMGGAYGGSFYMSSISLGNPNPNLGFFNAHDSAFPQSEVDEILQWLVDGNRTISDGTCFVDLCGGTNASPSSTGLSNVAILVSRGWNVCVNTSSELPIVQTNEATNISRTSVTLNGSVINEGGASVTSRGVCYGISANPTTAGTNVVLGSGSGSFSGNVSGLSPNTLYHHRAYATNSFGTSYGNDLTFTTLASQGFPQLTTISPTSIGTTDAMSGGIVLSNGGYPLVEKGVCYKVGSTPTYSDLKTSEGSGDSNFTSHITGLSPNTEYHVRAYGRNMYDDGSFITYLLGYGQEEIFMTASDAGCDLPTVTTNSVNTVTSNSASGGGNVTSDGGCEVTAKGLCWSTEMNPTTENSHTTDGSGVGAFSSSITGLTCGNTYYVRAYATNSSGTAYGNQVSFTTTSLNYAIQGFFFRVNTVEGGDLIISSQTIAETACYNLYNQTLVVASLQNYRLSYFGIGGILYDPTNACQVSSLTNWRIIARDESGISTAYVVHVTNGVIDYFSKCHP